MKISAIAAMASNRVIGDSALSKAQKLPWHIPEDMRRFKQLTTAGTVIMGRLTWESLPENFRPLSGRRNIVISSNQDYSAIGAEVFASPAKAIEFLKQQNEPPKQIWIIGGAKIYADTLSIWDELYLTRLAQSFTGDAYFPYFEDQFRLIEQEPHQSFTFEHYVRA